VRSLGDKEFRKRSSLAVNKDLLIDLGPDVATASYLYGFPLAQLRYCLQTHAHSDHFDPAHMVTRLADYATSGVIPMTVFGSALTLKHMADGVSREDEGTDMLSRDGMRRLGITVCQVEPFTTFNAGTYRITALPSDHDPGDGSMIYCIHDGSSTLLYATDTVFFNQEIWEYLTAQEFFFNAVVMDHTYGSGIAGDGHLNKEQFIEQLGIMRSSGLIDDTTQVFATHISHEGNELHCDMERYHEAHGYLPAYDGLRVRF
jgi:phosphoribosyl 1,2-cyclic phosphate phosphodiesterase